MTEIRTFRTGDAPAEALDEVRLLLEEAFEDAFSDDDWAHTIGGHHVTVTDKGVLVAHAAVVPRQLEVAGRPVATGYVEGVATRPGAGGRGYGSLVMTELTTTLRRLFEMGALSTDRHGFYERLGWERWGGPSFVRAATGLVRTEDEDEGLMVLRFGRSATFDPTASISCDARRGDDW